MLFLSADDFFEKVKQINSLDRAEELHLAARMREGDAEAREEIIRGYLPRVAAALRKNHCSLELVLRCCSALEKAVDSFDFFQEGESFAHRLSWYLRQTVAAYIADKNIAKNK